VKQTKILRQKLGKINAALKEEEKVSISDAKEETSK